MSGERRVSAVTNLGVGGYEREVQITAPSSRSNDSHRGDALRVEHARRHPHWCLPILHGGIAACAHELGAMDARPTEGPKQRATGTERDEAFAQDAAAPSDPRTKAVPKGLGRKAMLKDDAHLRRPSGDGRRNGGRERRDYPFESESAILRRVNA